jgi:hypothetical protein
MPQQWGQTTQQKDPKTTRSLHTPQPQEAMRNNARNGGRASEALALGVTELAKLEQELEVELGQCAIEVDGRWRPLTTPLKLIEDHRPLLEREHSVSTLGGSLGEHASGALAVGTLAQPSDHGIRARNAQWKAVVGYAARDEHVRGLYTEIAVFEADSRVVSEWLCRRCGSRLDRYLNAFWSAPSTEAAAAAPGPTHLRAHSPTPGTGCHAKPVT